MLLHPNLIQAIPFEVIKYFKHLLKNGCELKSDSFLITKIYRRYPIEMKSALYW